MIANSMSKYLQPRENIGGETPSLTLTKDRRSSSPGLYARRTTLAAALKVRP